MTAAKKEGSLLFVSCVYKNMVSHYISVFKMQLIKIMTEWNEKYSALLYNINYGKSRLYVSVKQTTNTMNIGGKNTKIFTGTL